ncbi:flagellar assembly protein FliH [Nitrincola sp. MINF-07-Sa-05]|uniref:flagellar assembly protein FliH n=1 Tax=Nitrincola salilacus TaxID=3400273 RepID=UPI003917BFB0
MKPEQNQPIRIPASEVGDIALWKLPEMVGGFETRALHREQGPEVVVVDEEIVAEKVTLAELEKIHEEAYQEGLGIGQKDGLEQGKKAGFEQGLEQGIAAGQAQINARLELLDSLIEKLQAPLAGQEAALEETLVKLSLNLAESVVRAELKSRRDLLATSVHEALALIPQDSGPVKLYLHPADCERFSELPAVDNLTLIDDAELTEGGCRVSSSYTHVDFTVEQRFAEVSSQLLLRLTAAKADSE